MSIYSQILEAYTDIIGEIAVGYHIDIPAKIYTLRENADLKDESIHRVIEYAYDIIREAQPTELLDEISYYDEVDNWDELIENAQLYNTSWDFSKGHATSLKDVVAAMITIYVLSDVDRFLREIM